MRLARSCSSKAPKPGGRGRASSLKKWQPSENRSCPPRLPAKFPDVFDRKLLVCLNRLLERTKAKVVLSSLLRTRPCGPSGGKTLGRAIHRRESAREGNTKPRPSRFRGCRSDNPGEVGSPARLRRSFWASYCTGICLHAEFCPISVTRTLRVGAPDEAVS